MDEWIAVWNASGTDFPALGKRYSTIEQQERERWFDCELDRLEQDPCTRTVAAAAKLAASALDLLDDRIERLLCNEFAAVARDLATRAREIDPSVSTADILQACRNAWTACGLQTLLGDSVQLTPAIFAYSMLYPYSDNYLDNHAISPQAKLRFSSRFRMRLAGDSIESANEQEKCIWQFVSLIEDQWSRREYPQVYDCLLEIHSAQEESICQQRSAQLVNDEILRLSFRKGGTSVLADAYLLAGCLNEAEIRFAFGWGVLLQLADDLQDLESDREQKFQTLFSRASAEGRLDRLTNRTLNFGNCVMQSLDAFPAAPEHFKELLRRNSSALIIRAAAEWSEFYSENYLRNLEGYSPVRFSFLKSQKERVGRWLGSDSWLADKLLGAALSA